MKKTLLIGVAAAALFAAPAMGADMPVKAPRAAVPAWNWSGFYAGVNVGYGLGGASLSSSSSAFGALGPNTVDLSIDGAVGGGQIGYNWQVAPNWVLGAEADFQGSRQNGSVITAIAPPFAAIDTVDAKINWFGTVRGRVGFVTDGSTLWYATGGWAYGKTELNLTGQEFILAAPTTPALFSRNASGWTIGGGIESRLTGNWTAKLEYLYVDLGTISGAAITQVGGGLNLHTVAASANVRDNIVRAGLNYKFVDGSSAPAASIARSSASPWSWGGFYAGLNVGYGLGRASISSTSSNTGGFTLGPDSADLSFNGVIGGGQIGYNWQPAPSWLLGVEADFQGSGQKGTASFSTPPFPVLTDTIEAKLNWFGTVRGRVGLVTNGSTVWYATGGWAFGRTELNLTGVNGVLPALPATGSFAKDTSGWTVGGGVESRLTGNWTAKLEYLYVDLGTIGGTATSFVAPAVVARSITASANMHDNIVRAGLNYKFSGPVVAKY